jgi:lipoate-protein ligase A
MAETWDFLQSPAGSAAFNMALDEALLLIAAKRGRPLLRIYSWEKPAVSFGYFQKFPGHLAGKYEIVRRPTGGGLVYHGDNVDTTYTVVVPTDHRLYTMSTTDAYHALHKAVAAALENCSRESHSRPLPPLPRKSFAATTAQPALHNTPPSLPRGQYECFQNPVHGDVVTDGRKLAGGAQRRNKHGMLHQGSIAGRISAAALTRGFCDVLGADVHAYRLSDAERALAEELVRDKYATATWNRR